jgi:predicted ATP-grasp superfamily ATP-dependent carboligase
MVQQIVPGGDDAIFWYSGFWDEEGRERAWFTVQKLRQLPAGFGDGCLQQTVDAPAVAADSRHLLTAFRYRGLVMVEFKRDPRDGAQFLMEINPRTVSGNQLGITAGVDLAWIAYRHLLGLDGGTCPPTFRAGVRYVNEEWDVLAFWEARAARRLTFWAWVRSLVGVRAWAIAAWDDPGPLLMGLWRMVVRMCGGRKSTT